MPIISDIDRKSFKGRAVTGFIYLALTVGGLSMVYPFLVMLTGSVSNSFDYDRRAPLPRYFWSPQDRLMHTLCTYFPPSHRASIRQMRCYLPDVPESWSLWSGIGDDRKGTDKWARELLTMLHDRAQHAALAAQAKDYGEFAANWDVHETVLAYDQRYVAPFLRKRYGSLAKLNEAWQIAVDDFAKVDASEWSGEPIDQPNYVPTYDVRYRDLLDFRRAYRENQFTPFLAGAGAPAGYLRPAMLRFLWEDAYAKATGEKDEKVLKALPFPVPADAPKALRATWLAFIKNDFPMRHFQITVDAARQQAFLAFLRDRFRNVAYLNRVLVGFTPPSPPISRWEDLKLTPTVPDGAMAKVWMDFLRTAIPVDQWQMRDTLPEQAFQKFALARYGSLQAINQAYGLKLTSLQQLAVPFGPALLITFENREWPFMWEHIGGNYRTVIDYLFTRGLAVRNTLILVGLAILISLTVNPLAGYALSRFRLRAADKIIIFCLATMAFPAAVAAIPGFLLLRDMGLLNTFAALVLPGAANGMSIFLLKGFFDSLPKELYEAATIDGAPEWTVFWRISLPLVKPILAVGMLNAFIASYNGWEWAIIVCQNPKMWTISVWTYQFYQTLTSTPFTVMAAFIVNSIPVLLVFLFCQKIILRGIILPQMK